MTRRRFLQAVGAVITACALPSIAPPHEAPQAIPHELPKAIPLPKKPGKGQILMTELLQRADGTWADGNSFLIDAEKIELAQEIQDIDMPDAQFANKVIAEVGINVTTSSKIALNQRILDAIPWKLTMIDGECTYTGYMYLKSFRSDLTATRNRKEFSAKSYLQFSGIPTQLYG